MKFCLVVPAESERTLTASKHLKKGHFFSRKDDNLSILRYCDSTTSKQMKIICPAKLRDCHVYDHERKKTY